MAERKGAVDEKGGRIRSSPFSPFPYGSPLQAAAGGLSRSPAGGPSPSLPKPSASPFTGSPGQKLLLGSLYRKTTEKHNYLNGDLPTPRLKGQDLYGGPVMFGSSARRTRLLSSTPYSSAMSQRMLERNKSRSMSGAPGLDSSLFQGPPGNSSLYQGPSGNSSLYQGPSGNSSLYQGSLGNSSLYQGPSGNSSLYQGPLGNSSLYQGPLGNSSTYAGLSNGRTPTPDATPVDAMSSTARLILETLDKMSTPIQDALKMPVPRAEKRKLVEEELNCSLGSPRRRRPRLGGGPDPGSRTTFGGPPLRKNYSPLPASTTAARQPPPPVAVLTRTQTSVKCPPPPPSASPLASASSPVPPPPPSSSPFLRPPPSSSPLPRPSCSSTPLSSTPLTQPVNSMFPGLGNSSTGGGKVRSKVTEVGKERRKEEVVEEVQPVPSFLANNIPVLQFAGHLPSISLSKPVQDSSDRAESTKPSATVSATPAGSVAGFSFSAPSAANNLAAKPTFAMSKPSAVLSTSASLDRESSVVPKVSPSSISFAFKDPVKCVTGPAESAKSLTVRSSDSPKFTFPAPTLVGGTSTVKDVYAKFVFSPPKIVVACTSVETTEVPTTLLNFKSSAMPDVTNNEKTRGVDVQGTDKGGLPDITASTGFGFGPAKQLKTGSVMDILGKKA